MVRRKACLLNQTPVLTISNAAGWLALKAPFFTIGHSKPTNRKTCTKNPAGIPRPPIPPHNRRFLRGAAQERGRAHAPTREHAAVPISVTPLKRSERGDQLGRPSAVSFHTACCASTPSPHPPEEESSPPAKRTPGTPPASGTFKPYGTGRYGAGSVVIRRPPSETRFPKIIPAASGRHDFLDAPHAGARGTADHSSRQRSPHNEKPCRTLPDDTERPVHGFGRIGAASRPRRLDSLRSKTARFAPRNLPRENRPKNVPRFIGHRARREEERQPQEAMEATSPSCNDDKDASERLTVRPMPFLSGGKVSRPKGNRTNRSGFGPFRRTRRDVPVRP